MKVLLVIHGYPHRYNAGSEIYTQTLAHGLVAAGVRVEVFAREEDPFLPDYHLRTEADPSRPDIPLHLVNHARSNARFRNGAIENVFRGVLDGIAPDVVHFGHLSHLSTGLLAVAKAGGARVVFTLHDFWLMCPRGQFLQWGLTTGEPWALCEGQEDRRCAERCFNRFTTGLAGDEGIDYWTGWVRDRMAHVRAMCEEVDLFIAPSRHLRRRHIEEFGLPADRTAYLDYGFDHARLGGRQRLAEDRFVFGYIGRHHPSKGIHHLIEAFCGLAGDAWLRIWGRPEGQLTESLRRRAGALRDKGAIEWLPEYRNEEIVAEVFDRCDCVVVPSIWDENSPLVIHEAQQAGVPVITADHGGMGEYVRHGVNGLTFRHRDVADLRRAMQNAADDPESLKRMGRRGYLHSNDGSVPSVEDHVASVLSIYRSFPGLDAGEPEAVA